MHTTTHHDTSFSYNSDFSGPIKIVVGTNEIETSMKALTDFVNTSGKAKFLLKKDPVKLQKIIVRTKYHEFTNVVNEYFSSGWTAVEGTLQINGISVNEDYEFRYAIILEKNESV